MPKKDKNVLTSVLTSLEKAQFKIGVYGVTTIQHSEPISSYLQFLLMYIQIFHFSSLSLVLFR